MNFLFVLVLLISTFFTVIVHCYNRNNDSGKVKFVCLNNGTSRDSDCDCLQNFGGKYCEQERHCLGYERYTNGTCVRCKKGFRGPNCAFLECKHGEELSDGTCKCTRPYSGAACSTLLTKDVYLHYNRMIYRFGPIGAFIIIPMVLTHFGCSVLAKKRHIKRVERSFESQNNTDISPEAVERFLKQ